MSANTKIQWCDSTVNPVMGCTGCELWNSHRKSCYAGKLHQLRKNNKGFAPDFDHPKLFPGRMVQAAAWPDMVEQKRPDKPWLDGLPRHIFVSDMGDALSERGTIGPANQPLADGAVPFEFLHDEVIQAAQSAPGMRHRWLWLTKRPSRMAEFSAWLLDHHGLAWPSAIWAGTSITGRATMPRLQHLRAVGDEHTARFLSIEPQWEEVDLTDNLGGIGWVIVGGESRQGSPAQPFQCDWARKLRDQCAAAGVPFFVKQLGSNVRENDKTVRLVDSHGGDWNEWPSDLRIRQMPSALGLKAVAL